MHSLSLEVDAHKDNIVVSNYRRFSGMRVNNMNKDSDWSVLCDLTGSKRKHSQINRTSIFCILFLYKGGRNYTKKRTFCLRMAENRR